MEGFCADMTQVSLVLCMHDANACARAGDDKECVSLLLSRKGVSEGCVANARASIAASDVM